MKTALVTGSAGFVGRRMARRLRKDEWNVIGVDTLAGMDMLTYVTTTERKFDLIVHAAAQAPHRAGIDQQKTAFPYNVMLDATLFEWAMRTKQPRIVYLSSSAVYPASLQEPTASRKLSEHMVGPVANHAAPADVYGWTKLTGEQMAHQANSSGTIVHVVRPFSGYGEDQSTNFPFRAFVERALARENPFTIWGDASQIRDWIHIDDVVAGILKIVEDDVRTPVNLCTGIGTSMYQLVMKMCDYLNFVPEVKVDRDAPLGVFYRVGDPMRFFQHYQPRITIDEGVRRALRS